MCDEIILLASGFRHFQTTADHDLECQESSRIHKMQYAPSDQKKAKGNTNHCKTSRTQLFVFFCTQMKTQHFQFGVSPHAWKDGSICFQYRYHLPFFDFAP